MEYCRIYWGSHGCKYERGHKGDHYCCCTTEDNEPCDETCAGHGPRYYGSTTNFYGEDSREAQKK